MQEEQSIGVFDSGMGGLTVLSALMRSLPNENMLYLGDTARLPYGTKSRNTIVRYAEQAAAKLIKNNIKMLVVACNTATAAALDNLCAAWPGLPILGVVNPGAEAACKSSKNNRIAVIATESTIRNQAYQNAIQRINPAAEVTGIACSLFVPLAEEGWLDGPIAEAVAARYLRPLLEAKTKQQASPEFPVPDCLVLGCTHFPVLADAIRKVLWPEIVVVDSAETTAKAAKEHLEKLGLLNRGDSPGQVDFMTTDDAERFARIGSHFLGREIAQGQVRLVNI